MKIRISFTLVIFVLFACQNVPTNGGLEHHENIIEPVVVETQHIKEFSDEERAFAGAAFGMSMNEVKALEYYKDWFIVGEQLVKDLVNIGMFNLYNVRLMFKNDKLYNVVFESPLPCAAGKYDVIKNELAYFGEVIERAYGKPTYSYGIPSTNEIKDNLMTAYVWEIGNKTITLSIGAIKGFLKKNYYFHATIADASALDRIKQEGQESWEKKIEEASSLF